MLNLFRISFKKTNECIILVVPLVIFLSVLSWYFNFARFSIDELKELIFAAITLYVMFCGFLASWLYMAKKALAHSKKVFVFDKDKVKSLQKLILSLPKGVGRLFMPVMSATALYLFVYTVIFFVVNYFISKFVGVLDFSEFNIKFWALSSREFLSIINGLEPNEIKVLEMWYFTMKISMALVSFVSILWIPEIVYSKKNAFVSLKNSIKKVFSNFGNVLFLYFYIILIILLLSALNEVDDKVTGFDLGANDYLSKPFSTKELIARVKVILKENVIDDSYLQYQDILLNKKEETLACKNTKYQLTKLECSILSLLIRSESNRVPIWLVIEKVWNNRVNVNQNTVSLYVSYLNRKLLALQSCVSIKMSKENIELCVNI